MGGPVHTTPFVDKGTIYFGSDDNYIYALMRAPESFAGVTEPAI